jgi:uncharacterized delta-60 repeat protein
MARLTSQIPRTSVGRRSAWSFAVGVSALALLGSGQSVSAQTSNSAAVSNVVDAQSTIAFGLDPSFGVAGIANVSMSPTGADRLYTAAVATDGRLYAAGYLAEGTDFLFSVVRIDSKGGLDTSFGNNGIAKVNVAVGGGNTEQVRAMVIQSNGKIVVAGPFEKYPTALLGDRDNDVALARFDTTGKLDPTFGAGGIARVDFGPPKPNGTNPIRDSSWGLVVLPNDRLAVVGETAGAEPGRIDTDIAVAALSANGELEASFGSKGVAVFDVGLFGSETVRNAFAQPDGKILVNGYSRDSEGITDQVAVRVDGVTGARDIFFGNNGVVKTRPLGTAFGSTTQSHAIASNGDGFITVGFGNAGFSDTAKQDVVVSRFTARGELDTSWGKRGVARFNYKSQDDRGRFALSLPNGRFVVAGSAQPEEETSDGLILLFEKNGMQINSLEGLGAIVSDLGGPSDSWYGGALSTDKKHVFVVGYKGASATSGGNDDSFVARVTVQ